MPPTSPGPSWFSTAGTATSPVGDRYPHQGRLERAAKACAAYGDDQPPDYDVDRRGWQPPSALIVGGPLPGIGGVLQAGHNALVHLEHLPNALNLRRVLDGQRILSHEAAGRARNVAPDLSERWLEREQVYQRLIAETRNVGGLVGDGGLAAAECATAVARLRRVGVNEVTTAEPLRDLGKLFTRTDARLAAIIEQGVAERHYFVSAKVPRIVDGTGQLVSPVRERYMPITAPVQTDVIAITRHDLRPQAVARTAPVDAHASRQELRESIDHRADRRADRAR